MQQVQPEVYVIGHSVIDINEFNRFLEKIECREWSLGNDELYILDGITLLPELMGRLCYRSWKPGANPNVTRIREGNREYIANILKSAHGSVLEHSSINFIFHNVSRVLTHELVRHRVGTAISQESMRFVRLDALRAYIPECFKDKPEVVEAFENHFKANENLQLQLAKIYDLDNPNANFAYKKEVTSAMRRLAPDGLATTIGWTSNIRNLRTVIEMRTSRHAEEEIRVLFDMVADICVKRWHNLFQDFTATNVNGINEWCATNKKV